MNLLIHDTAVSVELHHTKPSEAGIVFDHGAVVDAAKAGDFRSVAFDLIDELKDGVAIAIRLSPTMPWITTVYSDVDESDESRAQLAAQRLGVTVDEITMVRHTATGAGIVATVFEIIDDETRDAIGDFVLLKRVEKERL